VDGSVIIVKAIGHVFESNHDFVAGERKGVVCYKVWLIFARLVDILDLSWRLSKRFCRRGIFYFILERKQVLKGLVNENLFLSLERVVLGKIENLHPVLGIDFDSYVLSIDLV
jgi:hypothetical protein